MVWKHKSPAIIHAPAEALDKYGNLRIGGGLPSPRKMMMAAAGAGAGGNLDFYTILQNNSLDTNLKMCLDAGSSDSYSGSGEDYLDLTANNTDFFLGSTGSADGDEPTFAGSAGDLSINERFSVDGGDFFRHNGANPAWLQTFHKNNAAFTIIHVYFMPAGGGAGGHLNGDYPNVANGPGFNITVDNSGNDEYRVLVRNDSTTNSLIASSSASAIDNNAWNFVMLSLDEAGGASGSFWYANGSTINTFDAAYTSPGTGSATHTLEIFAFGNAGSKMPSGSLHAITAMWDTNLSEANADSLWGDIRERFGL